MENQLRTNLPEMPDRIKALPVSEKGYPVPFFVKYIDGKPDFRVMDPEKMKRCVESNLCWCCGQPLGRHKAFVGGPLLAINLMSAEPPLHRDCAEFAVKACPFLLYPNSKRRGTDDVAEQTTELGGGNVLPENPGMTAVWITNSYAVQNFSMGAIFALGLPSEILWYSAGQPATKDDVIVAMHRSVQTAKKNPNIDKRQIDMTEQNLQRALAMYV